MSEAESNFLARLPSAVIGAAGAELAPDLPSPQEVVVVLEDGTRAVITFERFHQRRGRL